MESINLAKPPETPENPEILYIHQDFVINALNTDPLPHKNFFEDSEVSNIVENHPMGYASSEYHPNIIDPFYPETNKSEIKFTNNPFLQQISNEFNAENETKIQEEGFNFQRFFENDAKQMPEGFFNGLNGGNQQVEPKKKTKGSFKNTYINKINHLMKNVKNKHHSNEEKHPNQSILMDLKLKSPEQDNEDSQNIDDWLLDSNVDYNSLSELEKINYKLAKNRESARNSRKRKKVYFEMLEAKVVELSDELNAAKKKIKQLEESQDKLSYHSKILNGLLVERKNLFDKLAIAAKNEEDDSELRLLIDSLSLRLGVAGKERLAIIDFFFKKIIETLLPPFLRYLICTASNNQKKLEKDFSKMNLDKWKNLMRLEKEDQVLQSIYLKVDQKAKLPTFSKRFLASYSRYKSLVDSLNNIRKEFRQEALNLSASSDDLGKVMKPRQIANLLLAVEQVKDQKDFAAMKLFLPDETFGVEEDLEAIKEENDKMVNEDKSETKTNEEQVKKKRPYNKKKRPKEIEEEINF